MINLLKTIPTLTNNIDSLSVAINKLIELSQQLLKNESKKGSEIKNVKCK